MNLVPGAILAGKYRIGRHLGDGAMGSVWEAINVRTQRRFALKLLRSELATGEARERMLREAHAAGRLQHKNVIEVYDVGETSSGDPFLVMELLQGETLEELASRSAPLPMAAAAVVGVQVCRALAAAHDAGIIHRDLKPANVFIHRGDGDAPIVKVLDFGVSKITGDAASATTTGAAIGSPAYMSPEQAKGTGGLTVRADLWSLGGCSPCSSAARSPSRARSPRRWRFRTAPPRPPARRTTSTWLRTRWPRRQPTPSLTRRLPRSPSRDPSPSVPPRWPSALRID